MNAIYDELRRIRRRPNRSTLDEALPAHDASPLEETIGQEALERYEEALAGLKDGDRNAIIARIEMGRGYDEIARALGKPSADAARVAVHRALVRLAASMERAARAPGLKDRRE